MSKDKIQVGDIVEYGLDSFGRKPQSNRPIIFHREVSMNAWIQDAIYSGWWDSVIDLENYWYDVQHDLDIENQNPLSGSADIRIGLIDASRQLEDRIRRLRPGQTNRYIIVWTDGSKSQLDGVSLLDAMRQAGLQNIGLDEIWLWEMVNGAQISPQEATGLLVEGHDCALYGEGWRHLFECELCQVSI
jgi:hypothetical protein